MISYIEISDFAIVKDLKLELFPGLNVITGETGAGKSVIIEAVSMALGARADSDYVRHGADKAVITLVIDTEGASVSGILDEIGAPEDDPLIIRREIGSQGRSLCRVNGMPVPLSGLSRLCRKLADIHGQYDQQYLLDPSNHINILDLYGGEKLAEVKAVTADSYRKYASASSDLMRLKKRITENARQRDLLAFELSEIESASLQPDEDVSLQQQIDLMENSESIYEALSSAHEDLFSQDRSAVSLLGRAMEALGSISSYTPELASLSERISSSYYELEDMTRDIRSQRDSITFSREELDSAIERMELISSLKRKYGGSLQSIEEYAKNARKVLSELENADTEVEDLEKKIALARQQYDIAAARLSALRKDAAQKLGAGIDKELSELNFKNARFRVDMQTTGTSENGTDKVEFLISANIGEELRPLAKVASGGELSRIMLALKRIIGDVDGIPTMIFDEIDTGISGATAGVVGEKLKAIAENHQIICITHLPQIAAKGSHHFKIEKHSDEISTQTNVVPLSEEERTEEIARLMSGTTVTDSARLAARELLAQ